MLTSQWSEWLSDPSRLLTVISRYQWQLAMTFVKNDGVSRVAFGHQDAVNAALDLRRKAHEEWTWESLLETLDWQIDDGTELWRLWDEDVETLTQTWSVSEPLEPDPTEPEPARSATTASTTIP